MREIELGESVTGGIVEILILQSDLDEFSEMAMKTGIVTCSASGKVLILSPGFDGNLVVKIRSPEEYYVWLQYLQHLQLNNSAVEKFAEMGRKVFGGQSVRGVIILLRPFDPEDIDWN